ncbi:hypothetical protein RRV45_15125 [Bacillus sp. DTU_2020_1000418_1_SI_GHA_SEK_038]|uniref:hypothetical protein n=1 Tax=Bacillus sp. DTU_2020_1000418_1_SI_GHA_SEK_038 TaxID=3077585 RepID=UPI0028EA9645|nr:hypothetical protein [Bacillus sp. DTU_2020_1000418_1_SI_GHA_SEK_038]WNS74241.1 hypothetical protein RRV45_15125 [Bacillus sp. DTU_2020_1000418_1_SI_GHA_SEK_038]
MAQLVKGVNQDGSVDVKLTGRNVEDTILVNALAVTDTTVRNAPIDVALLKKYKDFEILISNTLGQPIGIDFVENGTNLRYVKSDGTIGNANLIGTTFYEIPVTGAAFVPLGLFSVKGTSGLVDNAQWKRANLTSSLILRHKALTAPTSGTLTIIIKGVIN